MVSLSHVRLYKMLSFRLILLASAAFATIASAIPTAHPTSDNVDVGNLINVDIIDSLGSVSNTLPPLVTNYRDYRSARARPSISQ